MTGFDKTLDLVCLGEAMVEFDERLGGEWHQGIGGDTFNTAVAAKAAGASVAYATALGLDVWGDAIFNYCSLSGIETGAIARDSVRDTGMYFVRHNASGHQFSYRRSCSAATQYKQSEAFDGVIERCRALHYSGISLAIMNRSEKLIEHAVSLAKTVGAKVCFDMNYRPLLWEPNIARGPVLKAMKNCDILLPGMDDLSKLFAINDVDSAVDFCLSQGPELIVIKNGKDNVLVVDADGRHTVTPPTVNAHDANGAGDCFDGTFLAAILSGSTPYDAAVAASQAAAQSTLRSGATGEFNIGA